MPLRGIKVLELAGLAPAPFCGMVLSDFGASVVRVDKPNAGPYTMDCLAHGKRSIIINLKTKEGCNVLRKLSDQSDVVIEPFRKGVMESLSLGPNDLMAANRRLIYARLTGFGQSGPYANMAGHDINFLSVSGLLSMFGRYNQKPTPPVNFAADFGGGGLTCALGIVLALFERNKSNLGQVIDASMVEGTAYLGSWLFRSKQIQGLWGQPRGKNLLDSGAHFYDTYETKDHKFMAVGAIEPQFYAILLEKLNITEDDLSQYGDFESNQNKLSEIFKTKTQKEWTDIFDRSDACVTPVLTPEDVANNKHNKFRQSFAENLDTVVPNPAPKLSRTPGVSGATRSSNPTPGEHTTEVLTEYGFNSEEIHSLISNSAVKQARKAAKL
ncbi:alpha-methylacyl-CoA racemase [Orussus abietinus]|uniref:alpha-methylacyl-CoA racemase n=1 Tax=Orussus abietinus TaxID=222816 RepID=UPI0006265D34|nr:alpha-methylacyl-CoA racemase [Orussus abietinus]